MDGCLLHEVKISSMGFAARTFCMYSVAFGTII